MFKMNGYTQRSYNIYVLRVFLRKKMLSWWDLWQTSTIFKSSPQHDVRPTPLFQSPKTRISYVSVFRLCVVIFRAVSTAYKYAVGEVVSAHIFGTVHKNNIPNLFDSNWDLFHICVFMQSKRNKINALLLLFKVTWLSFLKLNIFCRLMTWMNLWMNPSP